MRRNITSLVYLLVHRFYFLHSSYCSNLPEEEVIKGVNVKRVWTPWILGRGPIMPSFPFKAFTAVQSADVINCHLPQFEAILIVLFAKLLRKKVILTHHCDLSSWPGLINQIAGKLTFLSLVISGFFADQITVYTQDYANHSRYLLLFKDKLVPILPPIQIERSFTPLRNKWKKTKYKIGFAGRISREKGLQYLFKSIPMLKKKLGNKLKVFIAGPKDEVIGGGYYKELQSEIDKVKNEVVFLGILNQKQMTSFYKFIDVLVLPSTEKLEAFGLVQVEAMLHGCPVVASNLPGVRVPVSMTKMGKLVPPKNPHELASSIVYILKNKRKYNLPRSRIKNFFDSNKSIEKYISLFL